MNTYTIRPTDYLGYVIKATEIGPQGNWGEAPNRMAVVCTAPNGSESGVLASVKDAEDWMIRHFQSGR